MKRDGLVVKNKVIRQVNGRLENKNVSFGWQEAIACFSKSKILKLSDQTVRIISLEGERSDPAA